MKKIIVSLAAVVLLAGLAPSVSAVPIGNSNLGSDYIISVQSMHGWAAGVFAEGWERDVSIGGIDYVMEYGRVMAYLGHDLLSFATVYATAGANLMDIGNSGNQDGSFEFGGGLHINILDHEVLDPTLFEDRLRINANAAFIVGGVEWEPNGEPVDLEWQEISASLIFSIVNDCGGEKFFTPFSITLFAGPIFSDFLGDDVDVENQVGFTAGLEVFYTRSVTFVGGIEAYNNAPGYIAGVHMRF